MVNVNRRAAGFQKAEEKGKSYPKDHDIGSGKVSALMKAAQAAEKRGEERYPFHEIGALIEALDTIDLNGARAIFSLATESRNFAFSLVGLYEDCKLDHIAPLMERKPNGIFHDAELRQLFQRIKNAHIDLDGSETTRRIEAALGGKDENSEWYVLSDTPGSVDAPNADRILDSWIEGWTQLNDEMQAARGEINQTLRSHSQRAQEIASKQDLSAYDIALMDLRDRADKEVFRGKRLEDLNAQAGCPTFDKTWLARLRQHHAEWKTLGPVDDWSSSTIANVNILEQANIDPGLLPFLRSLRAAKPSAKWVKAAADIAAGPKGAATRGAIIDWLNTLPISGAVSERARLWPDTIAYRNFRNQVVNWTNLFGSAENAALISFFDEDAPFNIWDKRSGSYGISKPDPAMLSEAADLLMRGAVWILVNWRDDETVATLQRTAEATLVKVSTGREGTNYRSLIVANACILVLGEIATPEAVQALGRIKLKVRDERLTKQIAKAMDEAAKRAGVTVADLQEMAVPTFELEEVGVQAVSLGEFAATLRVITTTDIAIELTRADGKPIMSLPAAIKADPAASAALKQLKDTAKAIGQALPVHRQRIEALYLTNRTWPLAVWRERYLDHPLIGTLARRLVWNVAAPNSAVRSLIWHDGALVDAQGVQASDLTGEHTVTLWHPIEAPPDEVAAWRAFLMRHKVVQPFKQAHRELYPLTEAERRTETYSNRFAGHILRQHQSVALARLRGWRATLRINADVPNDESTHLRIPDFGLAGELWTERAGGDDAEYTDSYAYVFISTDRVRFRQFTPAESAMGAGTLGEAIALDQIPPRLFSELMRDVDLLVGVASIGNDPTWNDGGADAEHPSQWRMTEARAYWSRHAAGELEVAGQNRRQFLGELLPSLKIASVCTLDDRYLIVRGRLHTYRIHIGSGNILMGDDRYLCIVPKVNSDDGIGTHLPFEGDGMLSIVLSKAVMLAADDKITDATILSQLKR